MSAKRPYIPAEGRLVVEFCAMRWPGERLVLRPRLGSIKILGQRTDLSDGEVKAVGVWRRWADAIVLTASKVYVVEAQLQPLAGVVSELELDCELFPDTPEVMEWRILPVQGVIVQAVDDPVIRRLAAARGQLFELFRPPWVDDVFKRWNARSVATPR